MATIEEKVDWKRIGKDAHTVVNELLGAKKFRYMGETEFPDIPKDHVYSLKMSFTDELIIRDETENREITLHSLYLNDFWEIK